MMLGDVMLKLRVVFLLSTIPVACATSCVVFACVVWWHDKTKDRCRSGVVGGVSQATVA